VIYTGIGSRETPSKIINVMVDIAKKLALNDWTLRSGAANGADAAFEYGCDCVNGKKEIYLPKKMFQDHPSELYIGGPNVDSATATDYAAMVWEVRDMPCEWNRLKPFTKAMMARNCFQILGPNLDKPSDLVICWTKDGEASGGTGQAIKLAELITASDKNDWSIPVINIQRERHLRLVLDLISQENIDFVSIFKKFVEHLR
jgi:hypothetical protein